jgi:hypothetical protein
MVARVHDAQHLEAVSPLRIVEALTAVRERAACPDIGADDDRDTPGRSGGGTSQFAEE